jgi:D-sedoheptulose 7-phosphate isomerase
MAAKIQFKGNTFGRGTMNRVEQLYQEHVSTPAKFVRGYFQYLSEILESLDYTAIENFIKLILATREKGGRLIFLGNGGSAATASHFANDLGIGTRTPDRPFRAYALTDNSAVMTAIGNDFGYDELFTRQLSNMDITLGDVVVAISASGNSPNVVKAIDFANSKGAYTVGLTGFDGGLLKTKSKLVLHVPSSKGEYGPVEDVHMIFDHVVHAYICQKVK